MIRENLNLNLNDSGCNCNSNSISEDSFYQNSADSSDFNENQLPQKERQKENQKVQQKEQTMELAKPKKKKMKPRGGNSPVIGDNGVMTEPGDNSKFAKVLKQILEWGPPKDKSNVQELEDRFWRFVDYCIENDVRITNQVTYLAIGISKDDVYDWESGKSRGKTHSAFIKKIKSFCSSYREMLGASGKLNPVTLVWWQKNYDGMTDKVEITAKTDNPLESTMTREQIEEMVSPDMYETVDEN